MMKIEGPNGSTENRAGRRSKRHNGSYPKPLVVLRAAIDSFNRSTRERSQMFSEMGRKTTLADILYSQGPLLGRYINDTKNVNVALIEAGRFAREDPRITFIARADLFAQRIRGVSLGAIEGLPYPLTAEGIRTINRFLRYSHISRLTFGLPQRHAQEIAVTLPVLGAAYPKEVPISGVLKPLYDRMTDFFDFYSAFIHSPDLDAEQERKFLSSLVFNGPILWRAIGCYLPGRLGITPSSAIKLVDEKVKPGLGGLSWGQLKKRLELEMCGAYFKDRIPAELHQYLAYDGRTDVEAATLLQSYQLLSNNSSEATREPEELDPLMRLHRYQKDLRKDILEAPEKSLRIPVVHPIISEVLVASQYKHSLTIILLFKNSSVHLTLDINEGDRIYGIPASLLREYPHVQDSLARDILTPLLNYGRIRHPYIETATKPAISIQLSGKRETLPDLITDGEINGDTKEQVKPLKRRQLGLFKQEPELPKPVVQVKQKFRVYCSRSQLIKFVGGNVPEEVVEGMMKGIGKFEVGGKRVEAVKSAAGHYKLRIGDWRVILEHLGYGSYAVRDAGNRAVIYDKWS